MIRDKYLNLDTIITKVQIWCVYVKYLNQGKVIIEVRILVCVKYVNPEKVIIEVCILVCVKYVKPRQSDYRRSHFCLCDFKHLYRQKKNPAGECSVQERTNLHPAYNAFCNS